MNLTIGLLAAVLAAAGCGSSGSSRSKSTTASASGSPEPATLILDFTPNAVHAGIYAALVDGLDVRAGVRLHVVAPSASTDSIKLLRTGRAGFAILDIHDLALARERGADIVGVMAIVQRPLAAVIAAPSVSSPRALERGTVGVSGLPSDTAVLDSIVSGAGGSPSKVKTITIGFNAVPDLIAHRVTAATAFWNDEGVTLARLRPGFHSFRVDDYGAPSYPELVLCTTGQLLRNDPSLVRRVVRGLVAGYRTVLDNPKQGEADLESRVSGLDRKLVAAQLVALLPAFRAPDGRVGELDVARLRVWARWEASFGIVRKVPDVRQLFDPEFAN